MEVLVNVVARKKLPAFGAALRDRRRCGDHPPCVHLIYGYKWRAAPSCGAWAHVIDGAHPELALKPDDYAPGLYDFGIVAGVQVCVFDQMHESFYHDDPVFGPQRPERFRFWWLIGELAAVAADVEIHQAPGPLDMVTTWSAFELAKWRRRHYLDSGVSVNDGWPSWWSAQTEEANAKRREKWCRIVLDGRAARRAAA